jgi:hypothetical protein
VVDRFRYVLARSTGEPLGEAKTARARKLALKVNAPAVAELTIDLEDELAELVEPVTSRLKVYRETFADRLLTRELVFYGSLPPTGLAEDGAAGTLALKFSDPLWLLAHRYSTGAETFAATDQGAIAWGLIEAQHARAGGDTFLLEGDTATGTLRDRTYDRRVVLELLGDLAEVIDGPDFYVEPWDGFEEDGSRSMGLFHASSSSGSDQPGVHFVYGPGLATNVANVRRTYLDVITRAEVAGTGAEATLPLSGVYGDPASSAYGLLEDYVSDPDLTVQATLDARAAGIVERSQYPRDVIELEGPTPQAPQPFRDYRLGDTVRATARKGRLAFTNRPLRVHGIDLAIGQDGAAAAKLTTSEE